MIVDIQDNKLLILDNDNSIDAVCVSQLSFWNFRFDRSENTYSAYLDQQLFLKVVRYFEKEEMLFSLSKSAEFYSKELEVISLNFDNLKRIVANYKDGVFDKLAFEKFREFVAEHIKRTLRIHQLKAAYHLYLVGNGANFSVPGSGKTSVVLTVYEKLRLEEKVNVLFVVGPPSSFGPWKGEFLETLGRDPHSIIMAGGNKRQRKNHYYVTQDHRAELYLTSFQTLLSDKAEVAHFLKQRNLKAFFVVDEAHYIKQIRGNWAQAILHQAEGSAYRCVLTGTPMPKSYTDIFNLFDFLWPKQDPIPSSEKTQIKVSEERGETQSVKKVLDKYIGPLFYRVRKTDLKLRPQNFLVPYSIEMEHYEKVIYNAIFKRIKDYSQKDYFKNIEFINKVGRGRIMRLRQSVSYPKLLNTAIDDYNEKLFDDLGDLKNIIRRYDSLEIPAKITFLVSLVKLLRKKGEKVVIWSNFIDTLKLIEKHLKQSGFHCKKIYGSTPVEGTTLKEEETREKIRDEFVDPTSGLDILIANPAACAESISLHKTCHHAIYYDLTYNCAQYLQSLDRIHRVGGSESVEANYHFLQYKNTIDIDIKKNIDVKTKKMFDVIEEDYAIYALDMFDEDSDAEAYQRLFANKMQVKKK
ncbi:MAG TPA: DEAD/DEAH box helicase [Chitinophagaceae bacterium]|nr:DEAD/DEAH box helicase [Chitinophagaceae bacterium]